jgi:hypothetical protein
VIGNHSRPWNSLWTNASDHDEWNPSVTTGGSPASNDAAGEMSNELTESQAHKRLRVDPPGKNGSKTRKICTDTRSRERGKSAQFALARLLASRERSKIRKISRTKSQDLERPAKLQKIKIR